MGDEKDAGWDIEATRQNYGRFRSSGRRAAEHGGPLESADTDIEGDDDARESFIGEGDGTAPDDAKP
ncbi:MAG: hypothetical protein QOH04_988 [Sphingomonadales bacterium]|jgi:hypothetical protein|nr:hypothetical protein [Sphingomonadales bacterium]MEA3035229.1 hypothetical protein [Sphingomonadales bacterium]